MAESVIRRDPKILGGTPVFSGTKVSIRIVWDHVEEGIRLDEFLDDFPSVLQEQAVAVLDSATAVLLDNTHEGIA